MVRLPVLVVLSLSAGHLPAGASEIGDADRGRTVFERDCTTCHQVGAMAENSIGPRLNGVFGRRAGGLADYRYSRSMARMGSDGLTWTLQTLDAYVENPKALVSGTRMAFDGIGSPRERADLLAYLRDWSDRPQNIPEAEPTARRSDPDAPGGMAIPQIRGDPAFGAYLAAECQTCHRRDGADHGIPAITHWPEADFAAAMYAYKRGLRPHQVMQMMAARLTDEEIAALAAYFAAPD